VAGCYKCGDEPSGYCTTELVSLTSISKWRTFKLLRWFQNVKQSTWGRKGLSLVTIDNHTIPL
jgi:hypothetical protein